MIETSNNIEPDKIESLIPLIIEDKESDPNFVYIFRTYQPSMQKYLILKVDKQIFTQAANMGFRELCFAELLTTNFNTFKDSKKFFLGNVSTLKFFYYGSLNTLIKNHLGELI